MIQAIKTQVIDKDGKDKELSLEYEDDSVYIYIDGEHICTMNYTNNLKEVMKKIIEKW